MLRILSFYILFKMLTITKQHWWSIEKYLRNHYMKEWKSIIKLKSSEKLHISSALSFLVLTSLNLFIFDT